MSHPRPGPRRTLWRGLAAAATALGCSGAALAVMGAGRAESAALSVQYRAGTTGTTADEAEPWFKITNTSSSAVDLSHVTLRYYFTADGASYRFACAWAVLGCGKINGTVGQLAAPSATADRYLQISFTGGTLAPGADTGDIQLRLWRSDWQPVDQGDDYSFAPQSAYTTWNKVAAYQDATLVWGVPPSGDTPPTTPPTNPPSGSGVLFDDFDYSGPSDPALGAHGWSVRTSSGGPGVPGATWSAGAVSFPADPAASGNRLMQLDARTDGTAGGTVQAEVDTTQRKFFEGTYAARVYLTDAPVSGPDGDHVVQTYYTISPLDRDNDPTYSELDFEYLPNGGWGDDGPRMYATTWYTYTNDPWSKDNDYHSELRSLQGWHTLVMTVAGGTVTYYIDGAPYYSTSGKYYPRKAMTIDFNQWFISGELLGSSTPRTWREQMDWVYFAGGKALTPAQVDAQVSGLRSAGTTFTDTVPGTS
ncbi:cellulose binding domain-containing protein [Actinoallomurus acanthiterrae]